MELQSNRRPVAKRNIENFMVVWLDTMIDKENINHQNHLARIEGVIHTVHTFANPRSCLEFIQSNEKENIYIIISWECVMEIVSYLDTYSHVCAIYVYSEHNNYPTKVLNYEKIVGVFTEIEAICERLKEDSRKAESSFLSVNIIPSLSNIIDLNSLDPSFMYSQLIKECVIDIDYDSEQSMNDLVKFCTIQYGENSRDFKIVEEFSSTYKQRSPIWWYTRECFLYKMLNKALRTIDIEVILKLAFVIQDLHKQIEELHANTLLTTGFRVYRGQRMSTKDFEKLKRNNGGLLSFTSFLSTSNDKEVSIAFVDGVQNTVDSVAVLFIIDIHPSIGSSPFAYVAGYGYFKSEEEVIFSMNTVFRICSFKLTTNGIWYVTLQLTNDNDPQLQELTTYIRTNLRGSTSIKRLADLLRQMGEPNKSQEIYELLIERTDDNDVNELACLQRQLGLAHHRAGNLDKALEHYEKSLALKLSFLPVDHPLLSISYANIAAIQQQKGKFAEAMENYRRALNIDLQQPTPNQANIDLCQNNIGIILFNQGHYTEALENLQQVLSNDLRRFPPTHPTIAMTHGLISEVFAHQGSTVRIHLKQNLRILLYKRYDLHQYTELKL